MKRNGGNLSGTQRWRCCSFGASAAHKRGNEAKQLAAFLKWLIGGSLQKEMPRSGRVFVGRCAGLRGPRSLSPVRDEVRRVLYVDGIHPVRNVAVLIAFSGE